MITYVFICFNMIELICYVWWLSYRLICNHYAWNETSVLEVERKSRYHGYICIYVLIELMYYVWWLSYRLICNYFGWNESSVIWIERNQGTVVTFTPISFKMVEIIWLLLWLNDESICNHFDWNEIKVLGIERNSRYGDFEWIIVKSIGLK